MHTSTGSWATPSKTSRPPPPEPAGEGPLELQQQRGEGAEREDRPER